MCNFYIIGHYLTGNIAPKISETICTSSRSGVWSQVDPTTPIRIWDKKDPCPHPMFHNNSVLCVMSILVATILLAILHQNYRKLFAPQAGLEFGAKCIQQL